MKNYAVGVCNLFENVNVVKIVMANSKIEACVLAVGDTVDFAETFTTLEQVISYYYNGEMAVSNPVEILF